MTPSTFLYALAFIGFYIFPLAQGSGKKLIIINPRINRLSSLLPSQENTIEQRTVECASTEAQADISNEPTSLVSVVTAIKTHDEDRKAEETVQKAPVVSLEDRREAIFDALYLEYKIFVGDCRPGMIEWTRATAQNWPEYIDMSDMNKWSEEDIEFLSSLVMSDSITFKLVGRGKKNYPKALISYKEQQAQILPSFQKEAEITEKVSADSLPPSDSGSVSLSIGASEPPTIISPPVANKASILKLNSKRRNTAQKMSNLKSIIVEDDQPADPEKRAAVLAQVLNIYRRDSGRMTAEEIDWNAAKLFYLQNHVLPFSTGFETEGDVRTLEALMKNNFFGFHNRQSISSRRSTIYERLYKMYTQTPGLISVDPFLVKWCQIEVEGWPQGVSRSYHLLKPDEIEEMEKCLESGEIKFTLKNEKKTMKKIKRKIENDSSVEEQEEQEEEKENEEDEYLIESSSSESASEQLSDDEEIYTGRNKRKRKIKSSFKKSKKNTVEIDESQKAIFADEPAEEVKNLQNEIVAVLENLSKAMVFFSHSDRHKRIISEMMKCFNLLQKHANYEILEISATEVLDFLQVFNTALAAIRPDGEINDLDLKNFVFNGVKLRARLAGIKHTQERGKRVFKIPGNRIRDTETFGFLKQNEKRWIDDLPLLEFALDGEDSSIFS